MKSSLKRAIFAFSIIYAVFFVSLFCFILGTSWIALVIGCGYGCVKAAMIFHDPVRRTRIEKGLIAEPWPWDNETQTKRDDRW